MKSLFALLAFTLFVNSSFLGSAYAVDLSGTCSECYNSSAVGESLYTYNVAGNPSGVFSSDAQCTNARINDNRCRVVLSSDPFERARQLKELENSSNNLAPVRSPWSCSSCGYYYEGNFMTNSLYYIIRYHGEDHSDSSRYSSIGRCLEAQDNDPRCN